MKTFFTTAFTAAWLLSGSWTFAQSYTLKIKVAHLKSNHGVVTVGLYSGKERFLKKSFSGKTTKISAQTAEVVFENLPRGEYAISLYHDENANKKLDKNFIGIPTEDYACSNGAKGMFGPPNYDDAKFSLTKSQTILVNMNE